MVLEGLQVISIADDILIPGCSATDTEARIDYDRNLIAVLVRFEQHHVKLNVNKMKFLVRKAAFMGHVITTDGLQPNPDVQSRNILKSSVVNEQSVAVYISVVYDVF